MTGKHEPEKTAHTARSSGQEKNAVENASQVETQSGAVGAMYTDKERKALGLHPEPVRSEQTVRMMKDKNVLDVSVSDLESHRRMGWKLVE